MANRFPLIIDTTGTAQLKEIPAGDNLDFTSVGIANLTTLSVSGALSGGSLSITGNSTVAGNSTITGTLNVSGNLSATSVNATSFTVSGQPLSSIQIQSDWNESNSGNPAFIRNKPVLSTVFELDDLTDVNITGVPLNGQILVYNSITGQFTNQNPAGVDLTAFSVIINPASGQGSLVYNSSNGVFTFTPALLPTAVSQLANDLNFTSLTAVENAGFIQSGDVLSAGRITRTVVNNQVTLGFDESGLLTQEVDTLQTVTDRNNGTTNSISAAAFNATDSVAISSFNGTINTLGITFGSSNITSTNGAITLTNGNITATNGTVSGNIVSATTSVETPLVTNTGDVTITPSTSTVKIGRRLNFAWNVTPPENPQVGDMFHNGETLGIYVKDDGKFGDPLNPAWIYFGAGAPRGFLLPIFDNAGRAALSPVPGETILNADTAKLEIWDGTSWLVIGP